MEEILGNFAKARTLSFVKRILTKIGLKPIILLIIHSNLCRDYLFPILINIVNLPLRLKYYKLIRINKFVPLKHLTAIDIIQKLSKIYEPYGVKFFLRGGLLLGAVRQESFAGGPGDIDLGLIDTHFDKFYRNIYLIQKNFYTFPALIDYTLIDIDKKKFKILDLNPFKINPDFAIIQENVGRWTEKDAVIFFAFNTFHFYFKLEQMNIDIQIYSLKNINDKKYWIGEDKVWLKARSKSALPEQKYPVRFSPNDLLELDTIKSYGLKFYSPKNPEKYLNMYYGEGWKIPDKKQFIWKDKMQQILEDNKHLLEDDKKEKKGEKGKK